MFWCVQSQSVSEKSVLKKQVPLDQFSPNFHFSWFKNSEDADFMVLFVFLSFFPTDIHNDASPLEKANVNN